MLQRMQAQADESEFDIIPNKLKSWFIGLRPS